MDIVMPATGSGGQWVFCGGNLPSDGRAGAGANRKQRPVLNLGKGLSDLLKEAFEIRAKNRRAAVRGGQLLRFRTMEDDCGSLRAMNAGQATPDSAKRFGIGGWGNCPAPFHDLLAGVE
jgi:hypothetical protein